MSLSPDGKWLWDGAQWIPAPPTSEPPQSMGVGPTPEATYYPAQSMPPQQIIVQQSAQPKSFGAALIFNFIWAGIGHMYLDDSRGLWMAIVGLISMLTIFLIPIYLIIWIISLAQTRSVHNNYLVEKGFVNRQMTV